MRIRMDLGYLTIEETVKRLTIIFPNMELHQLSFEYNDGQECSPSYQLNWYDFINILEDNGLALVKLSKRYKKQV